MSNGNYFSLFIDQINVITEISDKILQALSGKRIVIISDRTNKFVTKSRENYKSVVIHLENDFITPVERNDIFEIIKCLNSTVCSMLCFLLSLKAAVGSNTSNYKTYAESLSNNINELKIIFQKLYSFKKDKTVLSDSVNIAKSAEDEYIRITMLCCNICFAEDIKKYNSFVLLGNCFENIKKTACGITQTVVNNM